MVKRALETFAVTALLEMLTDTLRAVATEPTGATTSNIAHINARLRSK
jgi:hypothetical protein